jgi:ribosomal protein S18 acetylase RimI-like enzyme
MKGKKYCLLVAKEYIPESSDGTYNVVGMVEMGMSKCPVPTPLDASDLTDGTEPSSYSQDYEWIPQPTIGVLCIKSTHQHRGIGRAIIEKCEQIAQEFWRNDNIFVDVDPDNFSALAFFERCGYEYVVDGLGVTQMRNTTVFRRRAREVEPHWLLRKCLQHDMV